MCCACAKVRSKIMMSQTAIVTGFTGRMYLESPVYKRGLNDSVGVSFAGRLNIATLLVHPSSSNNDIGQEMSVAVVDSSTRQVHIVPLKRGADSTISEFIRTVEEQLTAKADEGQCIRVLCAAVGDTCINICDKLRTVLYYLLDGKPWYIRTGIFSSRHTDVCVRDLNSEFGNEAFIKVDLEKNQVKDLKQRFAKMTCTSLSSLHLMVEDKELENSKKLSQYNLSSGCIVPQMAVPKSVSFGVPPSLHIPQDNGRSNSHSSVLCPVWRNAAPGLWLEGKCVNEICVAHSKMVVMNVGFSDLDFISEKHIMRKSKCPMCYEKVLPTSFGFSKCNWRTVGLKKLGQGQLHPEVVRQDWQRQEDGFSRFKLNKESWLKFKITCRELKKPSSCACCMSSLLSGLHVEQCGHVVHTSCMDSGGGKCLVCVGEQTMTAFQNYF